MRMAMMGLVAVVGCSTQNTVMAPQAPPALDEIVLLEQTRADASSLAVFLSDINPTVRWRATLALARLERADAVTALENATADVSAPVRAAGAFGLGQLDLGLDPQNERHEVIRAQVEKQLLLLLEHEDNNDVREQIIAALGRVANRAGLDVLMRTAELSGVTAERVRALEALAVSGARRKASLSRDGRLLSLVSAALLRPSEAAAAAAVVFRQQLVLAPTTLRDAAPEALPFLARAIDAAPEVRSAFAAQAVAASPETQMEWLRVLEKHGVPDEATALAVDRILLAHAKLPLPSSAHVVREACALWGRHGTEASIKVLQAAIAALPTSSPATRCTCAAALDVLGSPGSAAVCRNQSSPRDVALFELERVPLLRNGQRNKVVELTPWLTNADASIRLLAATLFVDTAETADVLSMALSRLNNEEDPATAAIWLTWLKDEQPERFDDVVMIATTRRFFSQTSPEGIEPLAIVASFARQQPSLATGELLQRLEGHPSPLVKAATRSEQGIDAPPGPRARVIVPAANLPSGAMVRTTRGNIQLLLERDLAPLTTQTFVELATSGNYAGTRFHRVIGNFVAQGGCPRGDGSGGPGFAIPDESSSLPFVRGAIGIATSGRDTGGSQFFFTLSRQPHLDGRYTVFARVSTGLDVMERLEPSDRILGVDLLP